MVKNSCVIWAGITGMFVTFVFGDTCQNDTPFLRVCLPVGAVVPGSRFWRNLLHYRCVSSGGV